MVAARLCPTPTQLHAVEDILQEVMLALTRGIHRLEHRTVGGLKAYASGIVRHKVAEWLRRQRRGAGAGTRSLESTVAAFSRAGPLWQFLSGTTTSPPSAAGRDELAVRLMTELRALKAEYRRVITLAFFDQLPTREIAAQFGVSQRAASMLLLRAAGTLRERMHVDGVPAGSRGRGR